MKDVDDFNKSMIKREIDYDNVNIFKTDHNSRNLRKLITVSVKI